jgi:hypothetical protein
VRLRLVADLADNLDDNGVVGALGIDIGDANLAILVVELDEAFLDRLGELLVYAIKSCEQM